MDGFDIFISSLKDILKYKVISTINTGDKTFDNLVTTLIVTILTCIFAKTFWNDVIKQINFYYKVKIQKNRMITSKNYDDCFKALNTNKVFFLEYDKKNVVFINSLCNYIIKHLQWKLSNNSLYDMDTMKQLSKFSLSTTNNCDTIRGSIPNGILPVYIGGDLSLVGVRLSNINVAELSFIYENFNTFLEFREVLRSYETKIEDNNLIPEKKICKKIFFSNPNNERSDKDPATIYLDRTFDKFISKHKKTIINAIENFKKANDGVSLFNGFGTFNLGIMLFGIPGTGKTSLVKAICNLIDRDAIVIDMRKIKTKQSFENLFSDHHNYIYVLDEFDCVSGVISRDNNENNDNVECKKENEKDKLQIEYLKLLEIQSKTTDSSINKTLTQDLEKIKKNMSDIENRLTIDTILTVLDGINEMRGRFIIATTNYINRIDSALLREGRFDLKIKLEQYDKDEIIELLTKMYTGIASKEDFKYLKSKKLKEGEYTPVQLINICHKYNNLRKVADIISY